MIKPDEIKQLLDRYDKRFITIGVLGGHSALDVCHGAKRYGLRTLAVCQKGRELTYTKYYKSREGKGIVDDIILVNKFSDITKPAIIAQLQEKNTIFIHNRYFWVYCDFNDIENKFFVPIYGSRNLVRLEERDQPKNQYYLLEKAGIRTPRRFKDPKKIDRLVLVKVNEADRTYERAFFLVKNYKDFKQKADDLIARKMITAQDLRKAVIEEYIIGTQINCNFFYSPLTEELELMGTDTRRQTNLDGFLRLPANEQLEALQYMKPKMIETGHIAVTVKESLLEKMFEIGERFVATCKKATPPGIIGPFALQGAVVAEQGKEEIVIFDVSFRIPGSPGTKFTPYTAYLHRENLSYGERIALELKQGMREGKLDTLCT